MKQKIKRIFMNGNDFKLGWMLFGLCYLIIAFILMIVIAVVVTPIYWAFVPFGAMVFLGLVISYSVNPKCFECGSRIDKYPWFDGCSECRDKSGGG